MQNFIIVVKLEGKFGCIHKNKLFESEIAAALEKEKAIKKDKRDGGVYEYEIVPVWKPNEESSSADLMLLTEKQTKESIRLVFDLLHQKIDQLTADILCIRKHFSEKLINREE